MSKKSIKATEFDEKFDNSEDISDYKEIQINKSISGLAGRLSPGACTKPGNVFAKTGIYT